MDTNTHKMIPIILLSILFLGLFIWAFWPSALNTFGKTTGKFRIVPQKQHLSTLYYPERQVKLFGRYYWIALHGPSDNGSEFYIDIDTAKKAINHYKIPQYIVNI